jgi:serine/threonine protein kinase
MIGEGVEVQVLNSGSEFGGYRIEGLLGRGGMSEVYRASNPRLGNTIALKLLTRELGNDDVFRARFVRESQVAASLNHPNVIPIFDAGEEDGLPYIAMRYVDGPDLEDLLAKEGPLSLEAAVSIVAQVGAALDSAHAKGLIHRDVKPANILIESSGEATPHIYLSDFGVAKHGGSRSGLTSTGQFVGTVDYIAPEQIEGKAVNGSTDIYSLACVLYQTLTGALPFDRDSDVGMIYAHLVEPPPRLSEKRPDLPAKLDTVLGAALSKRPEDRYQTCREFVAAVRNAAGLETPAGSVAAATVPAETRLANGSPAGATPVPATMLAVPATVAASEGEVAAAEAASPATSLSTKDSERKTVLTRRLWRSKRLLVAVVGALLIGGVAAAAASTLGGGGSSHKSQGTKGNSGSASGSGSAYGNGTNLADGKKKSSGNGSGTTTTKSTKQTLSSRRASSSKSSKKSSSKSTSGTLSSRRSSGSSTTSSGSTSGTLSSRRSSSGSSGSSSSSSSGSTSSTLSSRRSGSSGSSGSSSSSSGSTASTLSSRRNK